MRIRAWVPKTTYMPDGHGGPPVMASSEGDDRESLEQAG